MASLNKHVPLGLNSGIQLTYAICLFSLFFVVFFKGGGVDIFIIIFMQREKCYKLLCPYTRAQ